MKIQLCLVVILLGVSLKSSDATITTRVCEHRSLYLRCPYGRQIDIEYALYGRTQHGICGGPVRTIDCRSGSSLYRVRSYCQGRHSCSVRASNGVFGDPCYGTFKYLEVKYSCVSHYTNPRNVLACEHQTAQLVCPWGRKIYVAASTYGRSQARHVCGGPVRTTRCRSSSSWTQVNARCHGRRTCSVRASNSVFGDPCYGTFKYLDVQYFCLP
ncbi:L-rhamnose-binding lectin CSL3-like [Branchiostoma floridae x Branchiostoma japonicum]